ncbi:inner membrane protein YpjD, partial [Pectobacterium brasiliense]|nr:inner membrane protein YpjD [Pectobacterium brasiliense]
GLIIPSLLRKNSAYRRLAIHSASAARICHAVALYQRIFDDQVGQNLRLLNSGSLVRLIICTVMTFVATRDRGWFIITIVYTFELINLA